MLSSWLYDFASIKEWLSCFIKGFMLTFVVFYSSWQALRSIFAFGGSIAVAKMSQVYHWSVFIYWVTRVALSEILLTCMPRRHYFSSRLYRNWLLPSMGAIGNPLQTYILHMCLQSTLFSAQHFWIHFVHNWFYFFRLIDETAQELYLECSPHVNDVWILDIHVILTDHFMAKELNLNTSY